MKQGRRTLTDFARMLALEGVPYRLREGHRSHVRQRLLTGVDLTTREQSDIIAFLKLLEEPRGVAR